MSEWKYSITIRKLFISTWNNIIIKKHSKEDGFFLTSSLYEFLFIFVILGDVVSWRWWYLFPPPMMSLCIYESEDYRKWLTYVIIVSWFYHRWQMDFLCWMKSEIIIVTSFGYGWVIFLWMKYGTDGLDQICIVLNVGNF